MKIGFSVRAWVLSAAAGLVIAGTINSGKAPLTRTVAAQTRTASAESPVTKRRPRYRSLKSYLSRNRRTDSQIEADSIARDSAVRQASNEVVRADGSASGEPRRLIERPAVRDAISRSRPARSSLFPSLFQRPQKNSAAPQQQVVTPRSDDGRSAVQRRLEELYRENGQEMPPMDLGALPESGLQQEIPPLPKAAGRQPSRIRQVSSNPFRRFFSKISPFRRKARADERPEHVEKMPQKIRQEQQQLQQDMRTQPAPGITLPAPGSADGTGEPQRLSEESQRDAIQAIEPAGSEPPAFQPAAELSDIPQSGNDTAPVTGTPEGNASADTVPQIDGALSDAPADTTPVPEIPTLDDIPSIDDVLGNPFPEVSEAEADAPATETIPDTRTPFSGLSLESEPVSIEAAADTDVEAPSLPELPPLDLTEDSAAAPETGSELPEINALPEPAELPAAGTSDDGAAPSLELPAIEPAEKNPQADAESKRKKIAERAELKGLKGFCPVVLRDKRDLVDSLPQFKAEFEGRTWHFSSEDALRKFEADPEMYAPANAGIDIVAAQDGVELEGTLDHAVWYRNRLYLFSSQQTLDQFSIAPKIYAGDETETADAADTE